MTTSGLVLASLVLLGANGAQKPDPTERMCKHVLTQLVDAPSIELFGDESRPSRASSDDDEDAPTRCKPAQVRKLLRAMDETSSTTARSTGSTASGRAIMAMDGPEGSGRFWQVAIAHRTPDGSVRSMCMTTSTSGYPETLGRAKKKIDDGGLPTLRDLDGDGSAEVIMWRSLHPEGAGLAARGPCAARKAVVVPQVYAFEGDRLVLRPRSAAKLLGSLAEVYDELVSLERKSCVRPDGQLHRVFEGVSRALRAAAAGGDCSTPSSP